MERTWLRKARGDRTCKAVGEALGISEAYYFLIEKGDRRPRGLPVDKVIMIAETLGMEPMDAIRQESAWISSGR